MILFLSTSFLSRLRIQWKADLKGFLVGDRNLFFFYPEMILESAEINPVTVESFLAGHGHEKWQLLGFLSPEELPFYPGYAELNTSGVMNPGQWTAKVHLLGDQGQESRVLEIKTSQNQGKGDS